MSLGKVARKLKRAGKGAVQFRFTSTFEYIDLYCTGTWRPDKLRIIWLRSHRRVQSIDVQWVPTEDRGPNGADGRATFDPPLSVSLIITLYRETGAARFDEKEYKYYIENDGPGGRKILASFSCDMSEYAGMPQAKHTLDMTFKSVSKKISQAVLGITLDAQFIKKGQSTDDDMQSTFSSVSATRDSMHFDEEDEDEEEDIGRKSPRLSQVLEETEPGPGETSIVTLGTGETRNRKTLPSNPPPKPKRSPSEKHKELVIAKGESADESEATPTAINADSQGPEEPRDNVDTPPPSEPQASENQIKPGEISAPQQEVTVGQVVDTAAAAMATVTHVQNESPAGETTTTEGASQQKEEEAPKTSSETESGKESQAAKEEVEEPKGGASETQTETEMETKREPSPPVPSYDPLDFVFEASRILASQVTQAQEEAGSLTPSSQPQPVSDTSGTTHATVQSKETWEPPPNPYAQENGEGEMGEEEVEEPSPTSAWLGKVVLVDCFGETVGQQKLDRAEIIGLYFSANWCPPCRRFLPKLVKFYHHLKQNNKPFEILYISSDYSKQEMMKYMQEQQMPWVGLGFDSTVADKLRTSFSVSAIPLFTIVSKDGVKLEDSAKKSVETAMSSSSVLKLYNKWHEKFEGAGGAEAVVEEEKQKKGLFQKMKDTIQRGTSKEGGDQDVEPLPQENKEGGAEASTQRQVVEARPQSKSRSKSHTSQAEKDEKIRHLEEVNVSLKQTNDDLNEELVELKRQLDEAQQKLQTVEQSSKQLEDEKRELLANINIRGWLFKRGAKGPTASVWRRRYFRCDQGSKIYYYKSATEGSPQGHIDLDKVVSVQEVSAAQQDKNHATFLVQCDGRTYQLQAHDEATMRKWMSAIEYLRDWRKRHASNSATP